ncbi:MAG: FAD-binding oxidoreductase, partial [Gammaproteobacteria bacterium]|nr:FAD-binding oxidoreductase [Gammaproteobacteria bacterium]
IGLGGSLSGEHGIGSEKRHFVPLEVDAPTLELMRGLKRLFDPLGLLNPGMKLPD